MSNNRSKNFKNRIINEYKFAIKYAIASSLDISIEDLEDLIENKDSSEYMLIKRDQYNKMMGSLSAAFKEGENKENERHLKEEDEAFKRGVKYGEEKKENEIRVKVKEPNNWIERERRRYSDYPGWLEEERKKVSDPPDWYIKEQEKYSDPYDDLNEKNQKIFDDFKDYFTKPDLINTPEDGIFSSILINRMYDMLKGLQK